MSFCDANLDVLVFTGVQTPYSTDTFPTLIQVQNVIGMKSGEISGYLNSIGIPNPTSLNNLSILQQYSAIGTAALVLGRFGQNPNDLNVANFYKKDYDDWVTKLLTDKSYQEMLRYNESAGNTLGALTGNQITNGFVTNVQSSQINNGQGKGGYILETFNP